MAVKKDAPVQKLDAAVEAAMESKDPVYGDLEKRQRARNMTAGERKRAARDKKRSRATYDLPSELIETVERLARAEAIPYSQLAAALMIAGLEAFKSGQMTLDKRGCRSPLYEFLLELPEIPEIEG